MEDYKKFGLFQCPACGGVILNRVHIEEGCGVYPLGNENLRPSHNCTSGVKTAIRYSCNDCGKEFSDAEFGQELICQRTRFIFSEKFNLKVNTEITIANFTREDKIKPTTEGE